ncbi:hypothetical protein [Ferrovibrio sp.]|uniref:hypothetical protein n=1 Tax=Ferrovibrio sp. TaxID=1917215 RepID=UPI003D095B07
MSAKDCIETIRAAGGGRLSDDAIESIVTRLEAERLRLKSEGRLDDLAARLTEFAKREGEKAKLAAALEKRQAMLQALATERVETALIEHLAGGLSPVHAVLAVLEGSTRGVANARASVAATRLAYEGKFVGDMMARLTRELPHAKKMLRDEVFLADVVREMFELRPNGQPGQSGNADALKVAQVFRDHSDVSRRQLNKLGAAIGNLEGWAGPQEHDPQALLKLGKDAWINFILPKLDQQRTFGRDAVALDDLAQRQARARQDWHQAGEQQRAAVRHAEEGAIRLQQLAERQEILVRRRETVAARHEELQAERGDNLARYMDNEADALAGKIGHEIQDRHAAGAAHAGRRQQQMRENAVGETRLRNKTEARQSLLQRIDGQIAAGEARIKQLQEIVAGRTQDAEDFRLRGAAAEAELQRLALQGDGLRPGIEDPREFLSQAYDTIISGRDNRARPSEPAKGPANLARGLEKHRVLHFRDADSWIEYNKLAGHGRIFDAMIAHQNRAARVAAQLQVLGPNPEATLHGALERVKDRIRNDAAFPVGDKEAAIKSLALDGRMGRIAAAVAEMQGLTLAPGNVTAARIGASIRAVQSMAKLGGAVISSISDLATTAVNLTYNGKPIGQAWAGQLEELFVGRGDAEKRQIAMLAGEVFDGIIGHMVVDSTAGDGAPGAVARSMETFFRWSGLTWWTDARRAGAARMLSAWLGENAALEHTALPAKLQRVLGLHGIGEPEWNVLRQARFHELNGRTYVTGDRIGDLPDDVVRALISDAEISNARAAFKLDEATHKQFGKDVPVAAEMMAQRQARYDGWLAAETARKRDNLEIAVRRYIADETNFAVVETDEASRRLALLNTAAPAGTLAGEALRFVMQFKGYPIAFTQRVLGRAINGAEGDTTAQRLLNNAGHLGHLIAGVTIAGYMSMTAKDALRGWDTRDPKQPATWLAAMQQGGGLGIYGDFLFGQASRFGNTFVETVAGPTLGTVGGAVNLLTGARDTGLNAIFQEARDGNLRAGQWLNWGLQNTPFLNLWYARPALDFLVLNSMKEGLSPGYLQRQQRDRYRQYRQERIWPLMPGR